MYISFLQSPANHPPMKELLILAFQQIYWALIADLVGLDVASSL